MLWGMQLFTTFIQWFSGVTFNYSSSHTDTNKTLSQASSVTCRLSSFVSCLPNIETQRGGWICLVFRRRVFLFCFVRRVLIFKVCKTHLGTYTTFPCVGCLQTMGIVTLISVMTGALGTAQRLLAVVHPTLKYSKWHHE